MSQTITNRDAIVRTLHARLPELPDRFGVGWLALFGSYARDEQSEASDVDLLVEFNETSELLTLVRLEHQLADILSIDVDLVLRDSLKPHIRERGLREITVI